MAEPIKLFKMVACILSSNIQIPITNLYYSSQILIKYRFDYMDFGKANDRGYYY